MSRKNFFIIVGVILLLGALIIISKITNMSRPIIYGVSPYQDTILPILAKEKSWYAEENLEVEVRILDWGDVMNAVAGGGVDVAIQNFNSFQAAYNNINKRGGDVVFLHPLFVFKGAAIIAREKSQIKSLREMLRESINFDEAVKKTILQFKTKKIIATKGTEMEQVVLVALEKSSLNLDSVNIVHAQPSDGLNAFLAGEGDLYSGGVTEQLQAYKNGGKQILSAADVGLVVIDGIVTRKSFAKDNPEVLNKLIKIWYKTTSYIDVNPVERGQEIINYLNKVASYKFTAKDYAYTWKETEIFPINHTQSYSLWFDSFSPYYWKKAWDSNNKSLIDSSKTTEAIPYNAFIGEDAYRSFKKYLEAK